MNKNEEKNKVTYTVDYKWSNVRIDVDKRSSDKEKAYAINEILNKLFFNYIIRYNSNLYTDYPKKDLLHVFYKFRPVFVGEEEDNYKSYFQNHSMISRLILDYPQVKNENPIVSRLRENYKNIIEFLKKDSNDSLVIRNDLKEYNRLYLGMLKHVLISDAKLPKNLEIEKIKQVNDYYYTVTKV